MSASILIQIAQRRVGVYEDGETSQSSMAMDEINDDGNELSTPQDDKTPIVKKSKL